MRSLLCGIISFSENATDRITDKIESNIALHSKHSLKRCMQLHKEQLHKEKIPSKSFYQAFG